MRLGGPVLDPCDGPDEWIAALKKLGYSAAQCPVSDDADDATVSAHVDAARRADVVIAEVGAWSNPLSPDDAVREKAMDYCRRRLDLADRVGARCCVNIAGSRGEKWDGPAAADLTDDTFALIVETVRGIIDAVRPRRTCYTLETMPWMYPDSAGSYVRLIEAIDRDRFAVHLDPVNLVNCPARYFKSGDLLRECFARLGPHVRSCHAKDIALGEHLTVHLDEVVPGRGGLDYETFLKELEKLDADTPLMMEHLSRPAEYAEAAEHIRSAAGRTGVTIR